MTSIFNKIQKGTNSFFNKFKGHSIYNKAHEIARKADNTVKRVGHFLVPMANYVSPLLGGQLQTGVNLVSRLRQGVDRVTNNLERTVNGSMGDSANQELYS